ncbi:MAG: Gfo/Idh/MocA family oxidoreductase [Bacteroidota bacterium]
MTKQLKIGILGMGHLGKIHAKCLQLLPSTYELVGFFDPDETQAKEMAKEFDIPLFTSEDELIEAVEVVDIVAPTSVHFPLAKKAMLAGKHIFIEKPLTHSLEEARELIKISEEQDVKVQVGHVERFNPALLALGDQLLQPMFVEGHRLATFNPRGTDVSVVLDLMIHDLDILLHLVKAKVESVSASGVAVVSDNVDIANVRIEFENGCVANLTASRISIKQMRKIRLFQQDAYVSLDFLEKKAQIIRLQNEKNAETALPIPTSQGERWMTMEQPDIEPVNAIKMELSTFAESILTNSLPRVSIRDGYKALHLAHQILMDIQVHRKKALEYFDA